MFCSKCGANAPDGAPFCPNCGNAMNGAPVAAPAPVVDPYDHTAEFDPKDISDNKVVCMLIYLASYVGIFVALLLSNSSKYVAFHVRQALKYEVVTLLLSLITAVLCWTVIVPIAAAIALVVLFVLRIISFCQICKGQAKEPAILCKMNFLK